MATMGAPDSENDREGDFSDTSATTPSLTSDTTLDIAAELGLQRAQGAFVSKLFTMLATPSLSDIISWTDSGTRFTIWNPVKFSQVLPEYFKHNNPQSFVRQLNIYNFHKVHFSGSVPSTTTDPTADGPWSFEHPFFRRDSPNLLHQVKRKAKPPSSGSNTLNFADGTVRRRSRKRASSDAGTPTLRSPPALREPEFSRPHSADSVSGSRRGSRDRGYQPPPSLPLPPPPSSLPAPRSPFLARPTTGSSQSSQDAPPFLDAYRSALPYRPQFPSPRTEPISLPSFNRLPFATVLPPPVSSHSRRDSLWRERERDHPSATDQGSSSTSSIGRQISGLDAKVNMLTEALYRSQQETGYYRAQQESILRLLLTVVADLEPRRRSEIQAAASALAFLSNSSPTPSASSGGSPFLQPQHASGSAKSPRSPLLPTSFIRAELDFFGR